MSQPILEIKHDQVSPKKTTANLLPCRIHHTGPIDPVTAYWTPKTGDDEIKTAYFRGRKLKGQTITLPDQYRGVVLKRNGEYQEGEQEQEEDGDESSKVGEMRAMAEFHEMVVWSHENAADSAADPYLKAMDEWLRVASQIHSYETADGQSSK